MNPAVKVCLVDGAAAVLVGVGNALNCNCKEIASVTGLSTF